MKANSKGREEFKGIVMSLMRMNFGLTRSIYNMSIGSPAQVAQIAFTTMAEHIGTRDLVQEFLDNRVFSMLYGWGITKDKEVEKGTLVRLPYRFKEQYVFKRGFADWLEMIEIMCNNIISNFTKKQNQLMTTTFSCRRK